MPKGKSNLDWNRVDVATLPPTTAKLYKAIATARQAFEKNFAEMVIAEVPTMNGKGFKFGYNFGGLSFAVTDSAPSTVTTFSFKPQAAAKGSTTA